MVGGDGPAIPFCFYRGSSSLSKGSPVKPVTLTFQLRFRPSFYLFDGTACVEIRPRSVGFISPRNQASISAR